MEKILLNIKNRGNLKAGQNMEIHGHLYIFYIVIKLSLP